MRIIKPVLVIYFIALPFITDMLGKHEVVIVSLLVLLCCLCQTLLYNRKQAVKITQLDVAIVGLVLYALFNILFIGKAKADTMLYVEWATALAGYVCMRSLGAWSIRTLLWALVISGVLQDITGMLQGFGIFPSGSNEFPITGSFYNPGPYGGYLAIAFIAGICLLLNYSNKKKHFRILLLVFLSFTLYMLAASDSRTAWLATAISIGYLLCRSPVRHKIHILNRSKPLAILLCCVLIVVFCMGLYLYKKGSADARLLVWTTSGQMIADAPVFGHGTGSFSKLYMHYQSEYFKEYPASHFHIVSDNRTQAFNEFVQIGCELGSIGLLLVCLLPYVVFRSKGTDCSIKALLACLCVFAFFSYPLRVFPLCILFPVMFGLCTTSVLFEWKLNRTHSFVAVILFLILISQSIILFLRHTKAFERLEQEEPEIILSGNKKYMSQYAKFLFNRGDYVTFINTVTKEDFPFMTSELACDMGIAYIRIHREQEAEQILLSAYHMVPSRILPKYLLFRLYKQSGKKEKAVAMGHEILMMNIKDAGSVWLEARAEVEKYLAQSDYNN
jgi:O-antigen ligase